MNWDNPLATKVIASEPQTVVSYEPPAVTAVSSDDKRVVNGMTDITQLAHLKYPWAWEFFINSTKNFWTPTDINMGHDLADYRHKLNDAERHMFVSVLAYLTTSDVLAMRNVSVAFLEKMCAPELQAFQASQAFQEAIHSWAYKHCIELLQIDEDDVYNRYRTVPEINRKIRLNAKLLEPALRPDLNLKDAKQLKAFVKAYLFFAAIFEGTWFYNGFSPIFSLQRRGLMKGTGEQLQYIMRDEVMHVSFGIRVVRQMMQEESITLDADEIQDLWLEAESAELGYANYILPNPILGYSARDHIEQFRFIANRRARSLGMEEPFPNAQNVLPWLDEQSNMRKEKNFFETRVTEYQAGGALKWD